MKANSVSPVGASNVTPEVLKAWEAAYPSGVFELTVLSGDFTEVPQGDGKPPVKEPVVKFRGWIRKPTRNEMREFSAKQTDPITYTEIVLDALWLGGDMEIKTDDEAFYSIIPVVQNVLDIKEAAIKKL